MAVRADATGGLGFDDLIGELRELASAFPDKRTGRNTRYAMDDVALAALAVFWTQSVSFWPTKRQCKPHRAATTPTRCSP